MTDRLRDARMAARRAGGSVRRAGGAFDRAHGGLAADLTLYVASAAFAFITAATSTLAPHRAWGQIAGYGYALAALVTLALLASRRGRPVGVRAAVTAATWAGTTLLPLVLQAAQRADGRADRAQEEVAVIEHGGARLLDTGTPYLDRAALAALPADERLLGYLPYQPGMALFGLPRALFGVAWWSDARVWFALVTAGALVTALALLARNALALLARSPRALLARSPRAHIGGAPGPGERGAALVRAAQGATVLPVAALTLSTGGDDLPVLALCLLALALSVRATGARRWLAVGIAVGAAGALKLFAWPVALVLLAYAQTRGARAAAAYALPAFGLPAAALLPAFAVNADAAVENVLRYPLGDGLIASTARSPFPGHLIASSLPGGRLVAAALLVAAGAAIALRLLRRPPGDAATAALICAYGLTAAILLMPSTRFGYALYPAAYLLWIGALRSSDLTASSGLAAPQRPEPGVLRSRATTARRTQGE